MDKINSYSLSICLLLYGWLLIATNDEHGLSKTSWIWIQTSQKIRRISNLKKKVVGIQQHSDSDSNSVTSLLCVIVTTACHSEFDQRWKCGPGDFMTAASRDDDDDGDPPAVPCGLHSHCHEMPLIFYSCGFFVFSSPILIGRGLDVYHTSTHDVALVRI